jgi:D-alanyl-D-alanine carboxypeptidase
VSFATAALFLFVDLNMPVIGGVKSRRLAERIESLAGVLRKGNLAYGFGLGLDRGWVGHNGEIPGYNTYLFYHPDLEAVVAVEVNSDISSGECPSETATMKDGPQDIPCAEPADRIFRALAEELGKPAPAPSQ